MATIPRLLIVDDEESILFAMSDYFAQLGWSVDCASDRAEAERLLADPAYAAIIADLRLKSTDPHDGVDLVRRVRARAPASPVLVLTAYRTPEIEAELRGIGVEVLLSKPQPLAVVAREIQRLLAHPGAAA